MCHGYAKFEGKVVKIANVSKKGIQYRGADGKMHRHCGPWKPAKKSECH